MSLLQDRITSMVHAFGDHERKDAVRALARDVGAMEARVAELERDLEQAKADRARAAMDARNPLMAQLAELDARCKRLEEAGDAMLSAWLMPEDSMSYSDWVCLSAEAKSGWYASKEAKP